MKDRLVGIIWSRGMGWGGSFDHEGWIGTNHLLMWDGLGGGII